MHCMFLTENPFLSGYSFFKSTAKRCNVFLPQPSVSWLLVSISPMSQFMCSSSSFAAYMAFCWAKEMRCFICFSNTGYFWKLPMLYSPCLCSCSMFSKFKNVSSANIRLYSETHKDLGWKSFFEKKIGGSRYVREPPSNLFLFLQFLDFLQWKFGGCWYLLIRKSHGQKAASCG